MREDATTPRGMHTPAPTIDDACQLASDRMRERSDLPSYANSCGQSTGSVPAQGR
ncbi:MAG TPA: hypothetical protein VGB85_07950 [Nannocystis sp.]